MYVNVRTPFTAVRYTHWYTHTVTHRALKFRSMQTCGAFNLFSVPARGPSVILAIGMCWIESVLESALLPFWCHALTHIMLNQQLSESPLSPLTSGETEREKKRCMHSATCAQTPRADWVMFKQSVMKEKMLYIQTTVGMGPRCGGEGTRDPTSLISPLTSFTFVGLKNYSSVDQMTRRNQVCSQLKQSVAAEKRLLKLHKTEATCPLNYSWQALITKVAALIHINLCI